MSSTTYSPIMDALLALLQARCGTLFKTYSRRLMTFEALTQSQQTGTAKIAQPALYVYDGVILPDTGEINYMRTVRAVPNKREMNAGLILYAQIPGSNTPSGPDATTPGGDVFYPLIEAIESALDAPLGDPTGAQTLGGLVSHCWLEGKAYMFSGDIDPGGQGMAIMPVKILIP